ncbi:MAG: hypothetical protein AAGB19_14430 [Cyanobacteria bacterium P01_F01_bin.3]
MTEKTATYDSGGPPRKLPLGTLLPRTDPSFQKPTPSDIRTLKAISGLTGRELSELVGLEDPRGWRRWSQDSDAPGARQIPYTAWRMLVLELGLAPAGQVLDENHPRKREARP